MIGGRRNDRARVNGGRRNDRARVIGGRRNDRARVIEGRRNDRARVIEGRRHGLILCVLVVSILCALHNYVCVASSTDSVGVALVKQPSTHTRHIFKPQAALHNYVCVASSSDSVGAGLVK